jgi:hypothetical protein
VFFHGEYVINSSNFEGKKFKNTTPHQNHMKGDDFVARGESSLEWTFKKFPPKTTLIHLGRRLQCYDQELTTFTPGFFPRAQVNIYPKPYFECPVGY